MVFISKNKKGNVLLEILTIIIILFAIGFTYIIAQESLGDLANDIKDDLNVTKYNESYKVLDDYQSRTPTVLDGAVIFIFFGLWFISVIFAYFINTHPVFFIVSFIFLIFIVVLLGILSNASMEMLDNFDVTGFPMTYWLMQHLLLVGVGISFSIVIALFAKQK